MVFPSGDLIQFVEKIWESLYDSLLILSSPHTNRSLLYILEFGFFSQTLYCISIFVNNRDQGFATFLTLNTTCMRKYQNRQEIYYLGKFKPKATV
jgi:hypothetical protein